MYLSLVSLVATLSDSGAALLTSITRTHSDHSLDSPTSDSFTRKQEACLLVSKRCGAFFLGLIGSPVSRHSMLGLRSH